MKTFTLHQLNTFIRQAISLNFEEALWVRAEIAQSNSRAGHVYMTLVQKETTGEVLAQSEAVCWNTDWLNLSANKREIVQSLGGRSLDGLWLVQVTMHERYGLKLRILDVDPNYSLGKLEAQRLETIESLERLGLMQRNKNIYAAPVFQRIAVFSSRQAAGYQDFIQELSSNSFGYQFEITLFEVSVQGQLVHRDFQQKMKELSARLKAFDCVVVIRGGGSKMDLIEFDQFELTRLLAECPLPVITGIGHERDTSVADMVAFQAIKTPTAVASWLINRALVFEQELQFYKDAMLDLVKIRIRKDSQLLENSRFQVQNVTQKIIWKHQSSLESFQQELEYLVRRNIKTLSHALEKATLEVEAYHPEHVLSKGYFLAEDLEGRPLKHIAQIREVSSFRLRQSNDSIELQNKNK